MKVAESTRPSFAKIVGCLSLLSAMTFLTLAGTGCTRHDPADSNIPWGRPATWEDRVPGMGDF